MLKHRPRRARPTGAALLAAVPMLALAVLLGAPVVRAQSSAMPAEQEAQARAIKLEQRRRLMAGPLHHLQQAREYAKNVRRAEKKHLPLPKRGVGLKKPPIDVDNTPLLAGALPRYSVEQALTTPTNVPCSNPTGDVAGAGQAEQAIATWGQYALVAWNDGQGFSVGPDTQGYGYSVDGGATFTDGGMVPKTIPTGTWTSDPVVTVNEKTGEFWYCGLYDQDATHSGIGVVKSTFSGVAPPTWGTVRIPDMQLNSTFFIDKQWCVVDSLNGNLYVTYTKFTAFDDTIMFTRSIDGGVSWSAPLALSNPATAGAQQGSRPVVGPNGEVYVVWSELGPIDADFFKLRKSTDFGVTFAPEVNAGSVFSNFGTGAPGFNRERSVDFPSIAVDRTRGPHRGRIYLAYHEAINWYNDALGTGGSKVEVENNNAFSAATPFTPGQTVRGTFSSTTDVDWFSFTGTQGTSYIFAVDSIPRPLYTLRTYCTDGTTRLTYAGELFSSGGQSFTVFTAPANATYYVRMFYVTGGVGTGGYRIRTGVNTPGPEIGRDQRDISVTFSDNGTSWATSRRVNEESAFFDDWLPEVAVGADGTPYIMWYDWRDALPCAAASQVYISRSLDGGATWLASQKVTTASTPWSTVSSNIAPNEGDYNFMFGDDRYVRPAWADGRLGTPDVFTAAIDTWFSLASCPPDTSRDPGAVLSLTANVVNQNPLFANDYSAQLTPARNWPLSSPTPISVGAGASNSGLVSLSVPDSAAAGVVPVCLTVTSPVGALVRSCCFNLTVNPTAGVGFGDVSFGLRQNMPNPVHGGGTRIDFLLPSSGPVRLEIFGLNGERVRTLVDGVRSAGIGSVQWDARDDRGHRVNAGTYFYRLTAAGRTASKRLVVLP